MSQRAGRRGGSSRGRRRFSSPSPRRQIPRSTSPIVRIAILAVALPLASGAQGSPGWNALVYSNAGRSQSGMPASFASFPDCGRAGADRLLWTRHWEDTTWLSAMAGASTAPIDAPTLRKLTDCTLNMPSLDKVTPGDGRVAELVWSWAAGFPDDTAGNDCALANTEGRFENAARGAALRFACADGGGSWSVSTVGGAWSDGAAACAAGASFAVPRSGYQGRLLHAVTGGEPVWVAYAEVDGEWTPDP